MKYPYLFITILFFLGAKLASAGTLDLLEIKYEGDLSECYEFFLFNSGNSASGICRPYHAGKNDVVQVYDLSIPEKPVVVSRLETRSYVDSSPQIFSYNGVTHAYFIVRERNPFGGPTGNSFIAAYDLTKPNHPIKLFEHDLGIVLGGGTNNYAQIFSSGNKAYLTTHISETKTFKLWELQENGLQAVYEGKVQSVGYTTFLSGNTFYFIFRNAGYQEKEVNSTLYRVLAVSSAGRSNLYEINDPATLPGERCNSVGGTSLFAFTKPDGVFVAGSFCDITTVNPPVGGSLVKNKVVIANFNGEKPTIVSKPVFQQELVNLYRIDFLTPTGYMVGSGFNTQISVDLAASKISYSSRLLHAAKAVPIDLGGNNPAVFSIGFKEISPVSGKKKYQYQADIIGSTHKSINLSLPTAYILEAGRIFGSCKLLTNEQIISASMVQSGKKNSIGLFRIRY